MSALSVDVDYEVRDYFGTVVSSGSVASGESQFVPVVPRTGWQPGWYRVYLTGSQSDANFGLSCGSTNFCVIRDDEHFVPMPAGNTVGNSQVASDLVMKGVMGIGTTRLTISRAYEPTFDPGNGTNLAGCIGDLARTNAYWVDPGAPYADEARPRYAWCDFPNGAFDQLDVGGGNLFMCKDETLDGSQVFVQIVAGTNPSTLKLQVFFPNSSSLVETFDNLPAEGQSAWQTAINGVSNYVVYHWNGTAPVTTFAKDAIGRAYWDGVVSVVETLYPLGCTHFEGPQNEPSMATQDRSYIAHAMRLFAGAVHTGHPDAKAIGPAFVSIQVDGFDTRGWYAFFNAGGHNYCDGLSAHAYNAVTNGDINLGRHTLDAFSELMNDFSVSLPLWQTESTHAFNSVYGVYHPRRARVPIIQTLLLEQYGFPKEQNNAWYDTSHGFWQYPAWIENGDGSLNPQALLYRVLAEEIWGKSYLSSLDFGEIGNTLFLGNVYSGASGKTVAVMSTSYMTGASVVLTISGDAGPVTVVDGFGRETTMPLSRGRITLPITDVPMYVRLSTAGNASVYRINGHSPLGTGTSVSPSATTKEIDGVAYAAIADGAYMTYYDTDGIAPPSQATPPSDTTLIWANETTIERVLVWCGPAWQVSGALIDFDVQTYNGSTWTTRKTVTKPHPEFFYFGTDSTNAGTFIETYWDEQWIFDVELDAAVSCQGVRLNVREASYGGEPVSAPDFGQGSAAQGYRIQEVAVTDVNRYAGVT